MLKIAGNISVIFYQSLFEEICRSCLCVVSRFWEISESGMRDKAYSQLIGNDLCQSEWHTPRRVSVEEFDEGKSDS